MLKFLSKRGGLLKALDLWDWYESLTSEYRKKFRHYYELKCKKDLKFPYRAFQLERGNVSTLYTKRTFLGTIAQISMLEGDLEFAGWLYREALKMEGTPYEEHLILNDLIVLSQRRKDFEDMERFAEKDIRLFKDYKEELFIRCKDTKPMVNSFSIYIYVLERKGRREEALQILNYALSEGVYIPFSDDIRRRLTKS